MDSFLKYFYKDVGSIIQALLDIVVAFFNLLNYLLNYPMRIKYIQMYFSEFGALDMVLLVIVQIGILAFIILYFLSVIHKFIEVGNIVIQLHFSAILLKNDFIFSKSLFKIL